MTALSVSSSLAACPGTCADCASTAAAHAGASGGAQTLKVGSGDADGTDAATSSTGNAEQWTITVSVGLGGTELQVPMEPSERVTLLLSRIAAACGARGTLYSEEGKLRPEDTARASGLSDNALVHLEIETEKVPLGSMVLLRYMYEACEYSRKLDLLLREREAESAMACRRGQSGRGRDHRRRRGRGLGSGIGRGCGRGRLDKKGNTRKDKDKGRN